MNRSHMTRAQGTAAHLLFASAALHVAVIALSGGGYLGPMLVGAVGWLVIGAGLRRGWRWLAYLAFLLSLVGAIVALGLAMGATGLTAAAIWAIAAADLAAAALLFGTIWRDPVVVTR